VASAKLLALLFPDCNGMVEVKAAAEAAREAHAAQKAMKQQTKRQASFTHFRRGRRRLEDSESPTLKSTLLGMPKSWDPPLPNSLSSYLCSTLGFNSDAPLVEEDLLGVSVEALSISEKPAGPPKESVAALRIHPRVSSGQPNTRQKQLQDVVTSALHLQTVGDDDVNEDVGRIVLRLGEASDLKWIYRLLRNSDANKSYVVGRPGVKQNARFVGLPGPFSLLQLKPSHLISYKDDGVTSSNVASRLWGPVTIILLLCRAIAPLDEPPLGCSILTLGFSMKRGKTLRIAEIGFEPHLPRERFIECLEHFAANMKCTLEVNNEVKSGKTQLKCDYSTEVCWTFDELLEIVEHHIKGPPRKFNGGGDTTEEDDVAKLNPGAPLQSVKEETELEEEKEKLDDLSQKQSVKPSKRSRVS